MSNVPTPSPRLQAAAVLLPCIGLFLVMPPVIGLFAVPRDVAGIPLIVLYLFGVWLWLSNAAARRALRVPWAWAKSVVVDGIPAFVQLVGVAFVV